MSDPGSIAFTGNVQGIAGTLIHVTAYMAGVAVPPGQISWTGVPDGMTVTPDATGFNFASTNFFGSVGVAAHGPGGAAGVLYVRFDAPPIEFTSP